MNPTPKRGEVFWVAFDPSVGGEIQKTRPAIVLSNDDANRKLNRVLVVPLTSSAARLYAGEAFVNVAGTVSKAIASQLTTVSKLRFGDFFGRLSDEDLEKVESIVIEQLGL